MNKEIDVIQVNEYLIGVDKEAPIKEGDWCYNAHAVGHPKYTDEIIAKASKNAEVNWVNNMSYNDGKTFLRDNYFKVIAHNGHPALADSGLPLLPEVEEDVEQLAHDLRGFVKDVPSREKQFWIDGYKTASKRFTEADVRKAFEAGRSYVAFSGAHGIDWEWEDSEQYLQSLKPSPKKFVMEMERYHLEGDEHLAVKKGLRPRINTRDGKTYLVGTYKY